METVRTHDNSVEDAAEYLSLPVSKARSAVRYYAAYRDEVDDVAAREIAVAERAESAWKLLAARSSAVTHHTRRNT